MKSLFSKAACMGHSDLIKTAPPWLFSLKTSLGFLDKCILEYLLEVCLERF